jgi:hypothetical protein
MALYPKTVFSAPTAMGHPVDMFCTFGAQPVSHYVESHASVMPIKHFDLYSSAPFFFVLFFAALTWNMFQPSFYTIYQCTGPSALASISLHAQVCCHIRPINHSDMYSSAPFFFGSFSNHLFTPSINVQGRVLWPASHYTPRFAATSDPSTAVICIRLRPFFLYFFFAAPTWNEFQPSFYTIYQCTGPSALAQHLTTHPGLLSHNATLRRNSSRRIV